MKSGLKELQYEDLKNAKREEMQQITAQLGQYTPVRDFRQLEEGLTRYETIRDACVARQKLRDKLDAIQGELALKSSASDSEKTYSFLETLIAEKTSPKLGIDIFEEA